MSFNTTAAACQNVMNASIAVEAISTRGAPAGGASDRDFMIHSLSTHTTRCPIFLSRAANLLSLVRHQDLLIVISTSELGARERRNPCSQSRAYTTSAETGTALSCANCRILRAKCLGLTGGSSKGTP